MISSEEISPELEETAKNILSILEEYSYKPEYKSLSDVIKLVNLMSLSEAMSMVTLGKNADHKTFADYYESLVYQFLAHGNKLSIQHINFDDISHFTNRRKAGNPIRHEAMKKVIMNPEDAEKLPPPVLLRDEQGTITSTVDGKTRITTLSELGSTSTRALVIDTDIYLNGDEYLANQYPDIVESIISPDHYYSIFMSGKTNKITEIAKRLAR